VRCPYCKEDKDKVIDSRSSEGGRIIRRRRHCLACSRRFTTYEKIGESVKLSVIKKKIQEIADKIEEDIFHNFDKEVSSHFIGEAAMRHLRSVDKVAYIRFASVYREFTDAGALIDEVRQAILEPESPSEPDLFSGDGPD
jgi:transcriptional repressor NrdR